MSTTLSSVKATTAQEQSSRIPEPFQAFMTRCASSFWCIGLEPPHKFDRNEELLYAEANLQPSFACPACRTCPAAGDVHSAKCCSLTMSLCRFCRNSEAFALSNTDPGPGPHAPAFEPWTSLACVALAARVQLIDGMSKATGRRMSFRPS